MKKPLKILLRVLGAAVALVLLLVIGLRLFLPAEKLRDLAVARAAAALGREVAVGDVRLSLRGGVGVLLSDVRIGNPAGFPAGDLLTAEGVDLKLQLRPLLSRRIHADRLVIDAPVVTLTSLDAERNNFTFAPAGGASGSAPAAGGNDASLDLQRCELRRGRLEYRDEATGTALILTGLHLAWSVTGAGDGVLATRGETGADSLIVRGPAPLALGPLRLDHAARIETGNRRLVLESGALDVAGLAIALTGEAAADSAAPRARFELTADALDLPRLLALIPPERAAIPTGAEIAGTVGVQATLTWDGALPQPLGLSGHATLADGRYAAPDLADPVTGLAAAADFTRSALDVTALRANVAGAELSFRGGVQGLDAPATAALDGELRIVADLAGLQAYLPAERQAELSGRAEGVVRLAGRLDAPRELPAGGEITVTDLRYSDATIFEPVTDLDAAVSFGPRDVTIRSCRVVFRPSDCSLTGTVKDLVPALTGDTGVVPRLEFALDSRLFNVDHLFPPASPVAPPGPPREVQVMREFPDFTGLGRVTIADLVYGGVNFTQITGRVRIADRVITVDEAVGEVFAGGVRGDTAIDLNDMAAPRYRGAFTATAIQADSLLTRFTPLKGHVLGSLDFGGTYTAAGLDPAAFRRSLAMDARSTLSQGRLVTSGAVQQGLNTLAERLGRSFDREEKLRDLTGAVKVAGERVILDGMQGELPGLGALSLDGSYGLAGGLELRGKLLLTEENSRKLLAPAAGGLPGALGNLLGRKDQPVQRLELPIGIGGTFGQPDIRVDFSALAQSAGQDVVNDLKGKLEGMFRR